VESEQLKSVAGSAASTTGQLKSGKEMYSENYFVAQHLLGQLQLFLFLLSLLYNKYEYQFRGRNEKYLLIQSRVSCCSLGREEGKISPHSIA